MKIETTETQTKAIEVVIDEYTLCDKCNQKIEVDEYDIFECTLSLRTGENIPDCPPSGELEEMHLCQKCSNEFMDVLKKIGYRINKSNFEGYY